MIVTQDFFVGVQYVDMNKEITNYAILEMFSNMSMLHGCRAGHTKISGLSPVSWVAITWKMKVFRRAKMFSTVTAQTWIKKASGYRAIREYLACDENGGLVAAAEAEWVAINTANGAFIRLKPEFMEPYQIEEKDLPPEAALPAGNDAAGLLKTCPALEIVKEADIYKCFFDYNGHVHNSEYLNLAEHILPEGVDMRDMDLVEVQYKLEIKEDEPKVRLEYARQDDRHIIIVRNPANDDFHAGLILTERAKQPTAGNN